MENTFNDYFSFSNRVKRLINRSYPIFFSYYNLNFSSIICSFLPFVLFCSAQMVEVTRKIFKEHIENFEKVINNPVFFSKTSREEVLEILFELPDVKFTDIFLLTVTRELEDKVKNKIISEFKNIKVDNDYLSKGRKGSEKFLNFLKEKFNKINDVIEREILSKGEQFLILENKSGEFGELISLLDKQIVLELYISDDETIKIQMLFFSDIGTTEEENIRILEKKTKNQKQK